MAQVLFTLSIPFPHAAGKAPDLSAGISDVLLQRQDVRRHVRVAGDGDTAFECLAPPFDRRGHRVSVTAGHGVVSFGSDD